MGQIDGLPTHVLIVHFVVVGVPLSALLLVSSALWPAARRWLGCATPLVALATLASVPVATSAGEWLERRVPRDPLVSAHTRLGDTLLPWVAGLAAVAVALWVLDLVAARNAAREPVTVGADRSAAAPSPLAGPAARIALAVLAVIVATGAVVQVYRIGESGARAAWHDSAQQNSTGD